MKRETEAERLVAYLEKRNDGYTCRVLDDGSVACMFDLLFSRAVAVGCTRETYAYRYCYESKRKAAFVFLKLRSQREEPDGYDVKREGAPSHFAAVVYTETYGED